ncbi:NTP transferase domain-containing protein [Candidatus Sumerlaeota bacterium]|nr:NTP transferase domain-containing protein [Candidatus Sumerlaeota bacterium]
MPVRKVVIPTAGWGVRLLPITKAVPKVMLPVGKKPVVQYVVDEAVLAGIDQIIFITGRGEEIIKRHFSPDHDLRLHLGKKRERESLHELEFEKIPLHYYYIRQDQPRGLGNAILQAQDQVEDDIFAVALGDTIMDHPPGNSIIRNLAMIQEERNAAAVLAVEYKEKSRISQYGVIDPVSDMEGNVADIKGVVEKPDPSQAPSCYAIAARYIFTPDIFDALEGAAPEGKGEWELTDAINLLVKKGMRVCAVLLGEGCQRHDVGHFDSYFRAFQEFSVREKER